MKRQFLLGIVVSCFSLVTSFNLHARDTSDSLDYELRPGEKMGYIITKNGEKIEGIVKLISGGMAPWENQKKVKFIAKADVDPTKKSQKLKVKDLDDIQEYDATGDNGEERKFRLVKYTNVREGLNSSARGIGAKFKTINNLATTSHLAELVVDGPISVYRLYGYPSPVSAGSSDMAEADAAVANLRNNPTFIFQKEGGKAKELNKDDVKELIEDCKVVADKLASGAYSSYDPTKEEKKRGGLGKLAKNEVDRIGDKLAVMSREIFSDYNANCGKK